MDPKKRKLDVKCSPVTFRNIQSNETYRNNVTSQLVADEEFDEVIFTPNDGVDYEPTNSSPSISGLSTPQPQEKVSVWVDAAVKFLISRIKDLRPKVGKSINLKSKKQMWEEISENLCAMGYLFNATQVAAKYFALERQYKRVALNNNKTGRNRQTCPYQNELDDILKQKVALNPEYLLDSEAEVAIGETIQESSDEVDQSKIDFAPSTSKKRKSAFELILEKANKHAEVRENNDERILKLLEDNLKKKEERAERKEALDKKKVELLERLVNHFEK